MNKLDNSQWPAIKQAIANANNASDLYKVYGTYLDWQANIRFQNELNNRKQELYKQRKAQELKNKPTAKEQSELTDKSLMTFGKYKGVEMINVPAQYLLWLQENNRATAPVLRYIEQNYDALVKEARNIKSR